MRDMITDGGQQAATPWWIVLLSTETRCCVIFQAPWPLFKSMNQNKNGGSLTVCGLAGFVCFFSTVHLCPRIQLVSFNSETFKLGSFSFGAWQFQRENWKTFSGKLIETFFPAAAALTWRLFAVCRSCSRIGSWRGMEISTKVYVKTLIWVVRFQSYDSDGQKNEATIWTDPGPSWV